jgi:hypothetical protein
MILTELRDRFALPHRPDGQGGWYVRCPIHADCTKNNNPSLHLSARADGRLLAHCFAGCDTDTVLAAVGLTTKDLMPPTDDLESRILAVYPYVDAKGILLYQVLRLAPKDFRQRRPDPAHPGRWIWNLDGVRKVLYRLPEVRKAAATSPLGPGWIAVVEGEKDADRLWSIQIPATTNAGGASTRWLDEYFEQLHPYVTGLVVFPDLDAPGRKRARAIIRQGLAFGGFQFKYVELPDLPEKGDVSAWLDQGGTREALLALVHPVPLVTEPPPESVRNAGPSPNGSRLALAPRTLHEVHALFVKWFGEDVDLVALDITLAAAASLHLPGDPAWLMLIGGPGVGKTEMVAPLQGAGGLLASSIASPGALLSGSARREHTKESTGGLLRQIGARGLLLLKDFSSILGMDRTMRAGVLAAFRELYDGKWVRTLGTDGGRTLTWEGRLVVIGACTTAWDEAYAVIATMGDRFLVVRLNSRGEAARRLAFTHAYQNTGQEVQLRQELSDAVGGLLATVSSPVGVILAPPERQRLFAFANLATLARTGVEKDYRHEVIIDHDPEMPTRFARQLFQVVLGAIALGLSTDASLRLAARCAKDSIPPLRLHVLDDLYEHPQAQLYQIVRRVNKPRNTVKRTLDELQVLDLITVEEQSETMYSLRSAVDPLVMEEFRTCPKM